jgi:hypothetical protein
MKTGKIEIHRKVLKGYRGTLMKDIVDANLNDLVLRAIAVYNRYRSPEATAKLVGIKKDGFIIEFKGPFCQSCGMNDYFEDFIYELEKISRGCKVEMKAIEPAGPQSYRILYGFKNQFPVAAVEEESLFREFLRDKGLSFSEYLASNACTKDVLMFHFRTWLSERKESTQK